jgi:hypothetical protein
LGGVAMSLLFGALYAAGTRLSTQTTDGRVAALDLDSEGSIASWFSIVLLFCCGQATLLVRRLRVAADGSRGESRAWLAVAAVWFIMSLDEGASLHEGFKELLARVAGTRIFGDGSISWAVPYFVVLSASGCFMLAAVRRTPAAVVCLFGAGLSFAMAVVMQLEVVFPTRPALSTWIEESCEMLGDLLVLITLGLHARGLAVTTSQSRGMTDDYGSEAGPTARARQAA